MTFVNPLLLAGAVLVVLPIVLHLIMRQKPKLLEFPALRLLKRRHDANRRRLRLRHLLLLLLRVLLIALVAMALARPSVRIAGGVLGDQKAPIAAAFVFDTSKRMELRHENRTRLEVAREEAEWLLGQLPPESKVAVLDSRPAPASFQVDLGAAQHRIQRLETTASAQPLTGAVDEALRLLGQSELERKELYVFTDLARAAWPAEDNPRIRRRMAEVPSAGAYLIDVGVNDPVNLSLGDLRLSGQLLTSHGTLQIVAEVSSRGAGGKRVVEMFLLEPDPQRPGFRKPQKRDERPVQLEAGQSQQVEFKVGGLSLGTHQGYVQILGQDGLAADDRRYFTVDVRPAWKVLLAAPKSVETAFLAEALAPTPLRRIGQSQYEVTLGPLEDLGKKPLAPYSAVCVLDPAPLAPAVWQALGDYAASGRGLAVFLGRNANPKPGDFESFNQPAAQEVLPGKLVRQVQSPEGDLYLAPRTFEHPILAALRDTAGTIPWDSFPVFRYWQVRDLAPGASAVLPFNDHGAALLERPVGKGRVLAFTTPVSDNPNRDPWNLLPAGDNAWPFFVLSQEMMAYLVGSAGQPLNYYAGQTAVLALNPEHSFRSYLLTGPDEVEVRLTPDLKQHLLVIASTDQPGNYRVQAGGSDSGVDRGFSVNLTPEQTRLDRIPEDDLKQVLDPLPYRLARSRDQIELNLSTGRVGRELFPILILAVAVLLALEHLAANRFYRES